MKKHLKKVEGVEEIEVDFDSKEATVKGKDLDGKKLSEHLEKESKGQYKAEVRE